MVRFLLFQFNLPYDWYFCLFSSKWNIKSWKNITETELWKPKSGSGLGLYICRTLMRKMNGDIFAEISNGGLTVTVVFVVSWMETALFRWSLYFVKIRGCRTAFLLSLCDSPFVHLFFYKEISDMVYKNVNLFLNEVTRLTYWNIAVSVL